LLQLSCCMQNENSFYMQHNYFAWLLGRASNHVGLGRTIWVRPDLKKRKGYVGPRSAQPKVPGLGPVSWAGPAHVCVYIYI
jgi:hypothetical protein